MCRIGNVLRDGGVASVGKVLSDSGMSEGGRSEGGRGDIGDIGERGLQDGREAIR